MMSASNDAYSALEPFLNTNDPAQIRSIVEQNPILLEPATLEILQRIIDGYEGDAEMKEYLASRYAMLQAMREYGTEKVLSMFEEHVGLVQRTDGLQQFLNTYGVEPLRELLKQHPDLLEPATDEVFEKVLEKYAGQPEVLQQIEAKWEILREARTMGVDAYFDELAKQEPLMQQRLLLQEFLSTNTPEEERILLQQYPELLELSFDELFKQLYEEYAGDQKALATLNFNQAQLEAYREHGVDQLFATTKDFEAVYRTYSEAWNTARESGAVEDWQAAAAAGEPLLNEEFQVLPAVRQTTLRQHLADTFNELAVAQYNGENPDQAALSHRRVLELNPENPAAWRHHARLMIELGDQEAAAMALQHARKLDPEAEELTELQALFEGLQAEV